MNAPAQSRARHQPLLAWRVLGPIDARSIGRDALLGPMLLVPLLVWAALRFGLPPLTDWLEARTGFDLRPALPLLASYAGLAMVPIIFAMIAGFLLLDERDTGTAKAIAVTPLPPRSYVAYRTGVPFLLATLSAMAMIPATNMVNAPVWAVVLAALLGACGAPLYALALATLANDKVQGFALVKVMSAIQILPVAAFWLDPPWRWIGAVVPSYWPLYALLSTSGNGGASGFAFHWIVGATIHVALLTWLLRRFQHVLRR
jgi:fluoroquinolone transport system permease protein